ncbi:uncharacterized protein EV422DRAFT_481183, partial [Fimicolochytrium jonesii]|uniref:uncharacterized protein n=1 Tax=Fimicolochytrium jonesii TaxID=1396493 RepID=UPI0022FF2B35
DPAQYDRIRSLAKKFFLYENRLYRRALPGIPPRLVPRLEEVPHNKRTFHGSDQFGHLGVLTAYQMIALRYFWYDMYNDIKELIRACHVWQLR